MCRFALYLGSGITVSSLVTEPSNSLIHQSFDNQERTEPLNGDGFGIAWYVPEIDRQPALFRSVSPAWSDQNLRHLARVTHSGCILAHVRAATPGLPVHQLNCHPFGWHRFAFMHNGIIGGFRHIRRRILERLSDEAFDMIAGSTDSEHLFALFVDQYRRLEGQEPLERMARALAEAIAEVEEIRRDAGVDEPSQFNLAVADGHRAVVTRFTSGDPAQANSLYVHRGRRYVCEDRNCRMIEPGEEGGAVIVSSERLSEDPGWVRVEVNDLVTVSEDLVVDSRPL
ncbi:MAG: class II glutamine amidotransferase [Thermoanaerobaculia bacterium]